METIYKDDLTYETDFSEAMKKNYIKVSDKSLGANGLDFSNCARAFIEIQAIAKKKRFIHDTRFTETERLAFMLQTRGAGMLWFTHE